jgi:hypothetical protein
MHSKVDVLARFSSRIDRLPEQLRRILFADLETAVENRLKVLERSNRSAHACS